MKIYVYVDQEVEGLPTEVVWLEEDWALSSFEHEHPADARNLEIFDVTVHWGTYKRIKFETQYTLGYYECESLEEFMIEHPDTEVLFHRGYFFLKTWE